MVGVLLDDSRGVISLITPTKVLFAADTTVLLTAALARGQRRILQPQIVVAR